MSLLSTLNWWITDDILLDNNTDSSFFLLTPLDDTPYRRMGMSYQVEEIVVPVSFYDWLNRFLTGFLIG